MTVQARPFKPDRSGQHEAHEHNDCEYESDGEADPHQDEVRGFAAREVAFAVLARLHAERGGESAAEHLPEAQGWRIVILRTRCAIFSIWFVVAHVEPSNG